MGVLALRFLHALTRPFVAGLVASLATAFIIGAKPPEQHFTERVVERVEVPGTDRIVYRTVHVCDGDSVLKALNEVQRSEAESGEGESDNRGVGRVGPAAGSAHASGDNASALTQTASASSGDAIIGQDLDLTNLCGTQIVNATNKVSDSKAVTGDAEASNEAEAAVGTGSLPLSSPSPSPTPSPDREALSSHAPSGPGTATGVSQ